MKRLVALVGKLRASMIATVKNVGALLTLAVANTAPCSSWLVLLASFFPFSQPHLAALLRSANIEPAMMLVYLFTERTTASVVFTIMISSRALQLFKVHARPQFLPQSLPPSGCSFSCLTSVCVPSAAWSC